MSSHITKSVFSDVNFCHKWFIFVKGLIDIFRLLNENIISKYSLIHENGSFSVQVFNQR